VSDAQEARPWFRPKDTGSGWTPATWQGWLVLAVFIVVFAATMQLVVPESPREIAEWPWLATVHQDLGVPVTGLGLSGSLAALGLEIAAFVLITWWKSRPLKPMD
jgi:hypothetical protein